ncbi:phosphotriesterase [Rugosimonospora acidiphila]|uniref:Phosphotriesterase n=1 Tax=Rugosimonospora acidiphila TaxID=556531 RepID=A0ABP9RJF5_9ACTN
MTVQYAPTSPGSDTSHAVVETVAGTIPVSALGTTLMHEHLFVTSEEIRLNNPGGWDEEKEVAAAIERARAMTDRGVNTMVDLTVYGLGRNIARIARVNAAVPELNIVAATGLYTYDGLPFPFIYQGPGSLMGGDEPMVQMFTSDIRDGIAGTGIKAAVLKCALENELTPGVERVLRAVAETHKRTGTPITVHTNPTAKTGLVAQRILAEEGVDPGRVVIGHSGDTTDLDYLDALIAGGTYLGMDRFGLDFLLPSDQRVATVAALAERGYADRMVLSHDASCHIDWLPPGAKEQLAPNWHHTYLHDEVIPALLKAGVTQEQLDTMLISNPRRYFTPAG